MHGTVKQPNDYLSHFGLTSFRPGQEQVIQAVLDGHDCMCIMPTGGGKSLCYQLPSVARQGTTLVVSPLIALMKDQVDSLQRRGIRATFVNSSLAAEEQATRLNDLRDGKFDLFYVAPERFRSPRFLEAVRTTTIQLLAVDEAHCISEWGHDFRHDYTRLGEFRRRLGNPQTIALTATATSDVRADVINQLNLDDPQQFVAGFARDNLHYRVEHFAGKQAKQTALLEYLEQNDGCGIIYVSSRKACEELRDLISTTTRRTVIPYHAGLISDDRRDLQEQFMSGQADVVVATNAFGMGIDKPDVRFVVHYNIPGTLEAYYQEAGRAGRDGLRSECLLCYSPADRAIQEFFIESAYPRKASIERIYQYLCRHQDDPIELTQSELKDKLDINISPEGVGTCERLLEKAGVLKRLETHENKAAVRIDNNTPALAELLPSQAKTQRRVITAIGHLVRDAQNRHDPTRDQMDADVADHHYIRLADVAAISGEEVTSVNRALREMNKLDWFDYVPPFRGRAVHMLRRDLRFDQLEIDYERIEQRRRLNLAKLDRMIDFAMTGGCRQRNILQYFGETQTETCGHCDRCDQLADLPRHDDSRPTGGGPAPTRASMEPTDASAGEFEVTRMVLSGVARAQGRFGKKLIIAMLCGSRAEKVTKWKLDQLSTFGLLSEFTQQEVGSIVDQLERLSLLCMEERQKFRPTVQLTELGVQVMQAKEMMPSGLQLDEPLLKRIKRRFGQSMAEIPDRAAPDPCDEAPCDEDPIKAATNDSHSATPSMRSDSQESEDHHTATPERSTPSKRSTKPTQSTSSAQPTSSRNDDDRPRSNHYWTWRLLSDGYLPDECSAIRGISLAVIKDHLAQSQRDGLAVDPSWLDQNAQVSASPEPD